MPELPTLPIDGSQLVDATVTEDKLAPLAGVTPAAPGQVLTNVSPTEWAWADAAANIATGVPVDVGAVNTEGVEPTFSKSDHGHAHGPHSDGTLHAAATPAVAGFMSAEDKAEHDANTAKLATITPGAEVVDAGAGLTKMGSTLNVGAADASITVNADSIGVGVLQTDSQHGPRGGGSQHALATTFEAGFMSAADKASLDGLAAGVGNAGAGLVKVGSTFDVVATDPSIVVLPDSIGVGVLQTDAQHGERGGGALHAEATSSSAGFMSATDKSAHDANTTKLAGIAAGAEVVTAGAGLTKAGSTLNAVAADASIVVLPDSIGVGVLQTDAQHGDRGGGALHAEATTSVAGFMSVADKTKLDSLGPGEIVDAGAGLTKSGTTIDVVAADASIVVGADSIAVGVLQTDAMHGPRGGGALHPAATATADGFMSAADKTKLDGLTVGEIVDAGAGLTKTGTTIAVVAADASIVVLPDSVGVGVLQTDAQHGDRGGGSQHAVATPTVDGFMSATDKSAHDANTTKLAGIAAGAEVVTAGAGLTKAGSTLDVVATDSSIIVGPDGIAVGVLQTDAQHGDRGGGAQHAEATTSVAGFMSVADKTQHDANTTKLAGIETGAQVTSFAHVAAALALADADIGVNLRKITSLKAPENANDAATKGYCDAVAQGLDVKHACRFIATMNLPLSGLAAIDSEGTPVANDRILCNGQTDAKDNGIWLAQLDAWIRAPDADSSAEVVSGMFTWVTSGSATYADTGWVLTTDDPIVLGTSLLVFALFASAASLSAGNGLTRTGNTFNVGADADGSIAVDADTVKVGVLATDAQHGSRGGGALHSLAGATPGVAGFMSDAQATKVNALAFGAGPGQYCEGNDGRLANARTPTAHANTHVTGSADAIAVGAPAALTVGATAVTGSAASFSNSAHVHPMPGLAVAGGADGFLRGTDQTKLNSLAAGQAITLGRVTVDTIVSPPTAVAYASAITLDVSAENSFTIALGGSPIVTFTNMLAGSSGSVAVRQDATGKRTVTFVAAGWNVYRDSAGSDLLPAQAPNAITVYSYRFEVVAGVNVLRISRTSLAAGASDSVAAILGAKRIVDFDAGQNIVYAASPAVSQWTDTAQGLVLTQANVSDQPAIVAGFGGKSAMRFGASGTPGLTGPAPAGLAAGDRPYVYEVIYRDVHWGDSGIWRVNASDFHHYGTSPDGYANRYRGGNWSQFGNPAGYILAMYCIRYDAAACVMEYNGSAVVNGPASTLAAPTLFAVGAPVPTNRQIDLYRLIVANPAPTADEHARVLAALRTEYPGL
jgi:hypothetical protein